LVCCTKKNLATLLCTVVGENLPSRHNPADTLDAGFVPYMDTCLERSSLLHCRSRTSSLGTQ
jgi:hypothetical protein